MRYPFVQIALMSTMIIPAIPNNRTSYSVWFLFNTVVVISYIHLCYGCIRFSAQYHWRYLHLVAHVPRYSLEMVHFGQMQSVPVFLRSSGRCSNLVFRSGLGRCHLLRHIVGNLSYRFSVFHRITRVSTPDGRRRRPVSFVYRGPASSQSCTLPL
jgi:hypothetical protein